MSFSENKPKQKRSFRAFLFGPLMWVLALCLIPYLLPRRSFAQDRPGTPPPAMSRTFECPREESLRVWRERAEADRTRQEVGDVDRRRGEAAEIQRQFEEQRAIDQRYGIAPDEVELTWQARRQLRLRHEVQQSRARADRYRHNQTQARLGRPRPVVSEDVRREVRERLLTRREAVYNAANDPIRSAQLMELYEATEREWEGLGFGEVDARCDEGT